MPETISAYFNHQDPMTHLGAPDNLHNNRTSITRWIVWTTTDQEDNLANQINVLCIFMVATTPTITAPVDIHTLVWLNLITLWGLPPAVHGCGLVNPSR
jgi:hypothetical protein